MSDAPAWAALALSVGNTAWLTLRGARARRRRLAAGPTADVRAALHAAREDGQHLVAVGGVASDWFLNDERRTREQRLNDLSKRVHDRELVAALWDAASAWRDAFAHAPAPRGARMWTLEAPYPAAYAAEDAEIARREALVADAARQVIAAAERGLDRLNALEAKLVGR